MKIQFAFDDELEHVLVSVLHNGWTWADYHAGNDAMLQYPPNLAIPDGIRVDQITDWRNTGTLPSDGLGLINIRKGHYITGLSDKDIPRNGGITVHIGNPVFVSALLNAFGIKLTSDQIRQRIVPTLERAREVIREHRLMQAD
ncbi:MAG: hypothetical protein SFZ02_15580 [bacterium]|nr:hypothetical protein [bacterium]